MKQNYRGSRNYQGAGFGRNGFQGNFKPVWKSERDQVVSNAVWTPRANIAENLSQIGYVEKNWKKEFQLRKTKGLKYEEKMCFINCFGFIENKFFEKAKKIISEIDSWLPHIAVEPEFNKLTDEFEKLKCEYLLNEFENYMKKIDISDGFRGIFVFCCRIFFMIYPVGNFDDLHSNGLSMKVFLMLVNMDLIELKPMVPIMINKPNTFKKSEDRKLPFYYTEVDPLRLPCALVFYKGNESQANSYNTVKTIIEEHKVNLIEYFCPEEESYKHTIEFLKDFKTTVIRFFRKDYKSWYGERIQAMRQKRNEYLTRKNAKKLLNNAKINSLDLTDRKQLEEAELISERKPFMPPPGEIDPVYYKGKKFNDNISKRFDKNTFFDPFSLDETPAEENRNFNVNKGFKFSENADMCVLLRKFTVYVGYVLPNELQKQQQKKQQHQQQSNNTDEPFVYHSSIFNDVYETYKSYIQYSYPWWYNYKEFSWVSDCYHRFKGTENDGVKMTFIERDAIYYIFRPEDREKALDFYNRVSVQMTYKAFEAYKNNNEIQKVYDLRQGTVLDVNIRPVFVSHEGNRLISHYVFDGSVYRGTENAKTGIYRSIVLNGPVDTKEVRLRVYKACIGYIDIKNLPNVETLRLYQTPRKKYQVIHTLFGAEVCRYQRNDDLCMVSVLKNVYLICTNAFKNFIVKTQYMDQKEVITQSNFQNVIEPSEQILPKGSIRVYCTSDCDEYTYFGLFPYKALERYAQIENVRRSINKTTNGSNVDENNLQPYLNT